MAGRSICRSCGAPVRWVEIRGKNMPLDFEPSPDGNIVVHDGTTSHVTVFRDAEQALTAGYRTTQLHTSHFATCPQATEWRRPR